MKHHDYSQECVTMSYSTHPTLLALSRPWLKQGSGFSSVMLLNVHRSLMRLIGVGGTGERGWGVGVGGLEEVRYV